MKAFLKRLGIFLMGSLLVSASVMLVTRYRLNHNGNFELPDSCRYLILGHSHAESAYNDSLISNTLNIAASGESYFYSYIKLSKILEQPKPGLTVLIEFSNNSLLPEMDNWISGDMFMQDKYRLYQPYAGWPERSLLYRRNFKTTALLDINSLENNLFYAVKLGRLGVDKRMGGYQYLVRDKTDSLLRAGVTVNRDSIRNLPYSEANITYLEKMVTLCREKNIKCLLVRSPLHQAYPGRANEPVFQELLNTRFKGTQLLDFANFQLSDNYFGDLEHLNFRGAAAFSPFFNQMLKAGITSSATPQRLIDSAQLAYSREHPVARMY